jgi:hypothetical protein
VINAGALACPAEIAQLNGKIHVEQL